MIVSIHQPAYIPWLGYFDKIKKSDVFVYLDSVQYEKNSFINRNYIKTANGSLLLTLPIKSKGHIGGSLADVVMDDQNIFWKKKHIKSIRMNYSAADYYKMRIDLLEQIICMDEVNISEYCFYQLQFWLKQLNIKTKIIRASSIKFESKKSDLVLDICQYLNADKYISGALGAQYLNLEKFRSADIKVEFQNYVPEVYKQLWGEFVPRLSIVDFWMNCK